MEFSVFAGLEPGVQRSLLAGYLLPELESYRVKRYLEGEGFNVKAVTDIFGAEVAQHVDALQDGFDLMTEMIFVYSADSMTDYRNDVVRYNMVADRLNAKYGEIVAKHVEGSVNVLGFVGYRKQSHVLVMDAVYNTR